MYLHPITLYYQTVVGDSPEFANQIFYSAPSNQKGSVFARLCRTMYHVKRINVFYLQQRLILLVMYPF